MWLEYDSLDNTSPLSLSLDRGIDVYLGYLVYQNCPEAYLVSFVRSGKQEFLEKIANFQVVVG